MSEYLTHYEGIVKHISDFSIRPCNWFNYSGEQYNYIIGSNHVKGQIAGRPTMKYEQFICISMMVSIPSRTPEEIRNGGADHYFMEKPMFSRSIMQNETWVNPPPQNNQKRRPHGTARGSRFTQNTPKN